MLTAESIDGHVRRLRLAADHIEQVAAALLQPSAPAVDIATRVVVMLVAALDAPNVGHLLRLAEQADKAHTEAQHTNWPELAREILAGDDEALRTRLATGIGIPPELLDNPPPADHWTTFDTEAPPDAPRPAD